MPKVLPANAGEVRAVDVAAIYDGLVLLIERRDGGGWALPGGMVEAGETDLDAMVRELAEETGVRVDQRELAIITNRLVVDDPRNRPDAWITTVVGVWEAPSAPAVLAGSDAKRVLWARLDDFDVMDRYLRGATGAGMYVCHRPLVDAVVEAVA